MLDKDDQDWFALLTGQSVPDAATDTVREAQALRRAVLAEHATPADTATDQAGLDRLLFRLQRAGLLTPRRPVWRRPAFVSTVAAAMLAICILLWASRSLRRLGPTISLRWSVRSPCQTYIGLCRHCTTGLALPNTRCCYGSICKG